MTKDEWGKKLRRLKALIIKYERASKSERESMSDRDHFARMTAQYNEDLTTHRAQYSMCEDHAN